MTLDPDTAKRLIAQTKEDDERMTPGPWRRSNGGVGVLADHFGASEFVLRVALVTPVEDAGAIARLRNNARPLADQLEAALQEVERLQPKAAEVPGLSASLDAARWERDVAIGNGGAGAQALLEIERLTKERDEALGDGVLSQRVCDLENENAQLRVEVERLTDRHQEHLALIAKITRETPYPAELEECRSARRALIAEVGTLRAKLDQPILGIIRQRDDLRAEVEAMRAVVEAAEGWRDRYGDNAFAAQIIEVVDAYRARKP